MNDKYIIANYLADAGSLLLGNKDFVIRIPNGYGDGAHKVLIANDVIDRNDFIEYRFLTIIEGKFNVYDYDCLSDDERKIDKNNVICELDGKYYIYYHDGDVLLERAMNG